MFLYSLSHFNDTKAQRELACVGDKSNGVCRAHDNRLNTYYFYITIAKYLILCCNCLYDPFVKVIKSPIYVALYILLFDRERTVNKILMHVVDKTLVLSKTIYNASKWLDRYSLLS